MTTLVAQIERKASELAGSCMQGKTSPQDCLTDLFVQLEEAAQDHLTRLSILAPPPSPLHCKQGCAHCCQGSLVAITPLEALFLLGIIEMCGFRYAVTLAARSPRPACPLLDHTGSCKFHPHRPLMCRAMNSLNVEDCKKCEGQEGMDVPLWLPHYETYAHIQTGLVQGLKDKGRAMPMLNLRRVLGLQSPVTLIWDQWMKGENPFVAAEME